MNYCFPVVFLCDFCSEAFSLSVLLFVLQSSLLLSFGIMGLNVAFSVIFIHFELVEKQLYKINP